jgi:hypothetical protein
VRRSERDIAANRDDNGTYLDAKPDSMALLGPLSAAAVALVTIVLTVIVLVLMLVVSTIVRLVSVTPPMQAPAERQGEGGNDN